MQCARLDRTPAVTAVSAWRKELSATKAVSFVIAQVLLDFVFTVCDDATEEVRRHRRRPGRPSDV